MLQKIVNGIAIASGVVSITVIGLGGYVFIRKDAIIENVKGKVMEALDDGTPMYYNSNILGRYMRKDYGNFEKNSG